MCRDSLPLAAWVVQPMEGMSDSILGYKAVCAGRRVVAVTPAFTSQIRSGCGVLITKGLSVRWHRCPNCGARVHRDHNAARNSEWFGQNLQGGVALAASEN